MPSHSYEGGILRVSQAAAALEHKGDDEVHVDFPVIRDHAPTKRRQICSACLVQEVSHWRLAGGGKIALSHIQRNILGFRSDMGPRRRTTAGVARKRCGANPDVETGAEGAKILRGPQRSNNMTPHIPEEFSTKLTDWSPFVTMGSMMPPRDPEDEEDEDEEEEDLTDEPPVVREPDED